jgi:hypothetical protein
VNSIIRSISIKIDDITYFDSASNLFTIILIPELFLYIIKFISVSFCSASDKFSFILLFDTSLLKPEDCLTNFTKTIIINDNGNYFNKNKTFIFNKNSISDEILRVQLNQYRYYHVVQLISSNSQFVSIKDELSSYLKCGIYYKCSFEFTLILLNQTCINNSECLINEINLNLNSNKNNQTSNQLFKDDAILFLINGNLYQTELIFDKLLKFIYEISINILDEYNNFDFIIVNSEQDLKTNFCELFSKSFLNANFNKTTTDRNYYEIRKIFHVRKDYDEERSYKSFCTDFFFENSTFSKMFVSIK